MGKYIGSWKIDDILQHKVQTSSVTTGAAVDADSVPTWRVYEDSTTTPVTTGSYTTFNALAGFYNAAITLAAAIGYEKGKNYYIRYAATVASIIGADVDTFQIEAEVDANSVSVTVNANPVALAAGAITAGTITDGALTSPKFGAGFITAGSITDGAFTSPKFGAGFITTGSITDGALTSAKFAAGFITAGSITNGALVAAKFAADAIAALTTVGATAQAAIADAIWDEAKAGHTTADTYGEYLDATISGISGGSADTTLSPTAQSALIDAIWGATRAAHSTAGTFGEGVASVQGNITGSVASVTNGVTVNATAASAIAALVTANSIGAVTVGSTAAAAIQSGLATQASVDIIDDFLDTEIAAIKAKTDLLTFTTLNSIKADIKFVNGQSVTGNGQTGTEWGPGS